MSIKLIEDLITPLFVGVNVLPEGDVVMIYNISMKEEAETLVSHFGIYAAVIFGYVVWEALLCCIKQVWIHSSIVPIETAPSKEILQLLRRTKVLTVNLPSVDL